MRNSLTKSALIERIETKTKRANPTVRADLIKGLRYKTQADLERIYKSVRVDKDGTGIRYSK